MNKNISREALYDLVWAKPMTPHQFLSIFLTKVFNIK